MELVSETVARIPLGSFGFDEEDIIFKELLGDVRKLKIRERTSVFLSDEACQKIEDTLVGLGVGLAGNLVAVLHLFRIPNLLYPLFIYLLDGGDARLTKHKLAGPVVIVGKFLGCPCHALLVPCITDLGVFIDGGRQQSIVGHRIFRTRLEALLALVLVFERARDWKNLGDSVEAGTVNDYRDIDHVRTVLIGDSLEHNCKHSILILSLLMFF